MNAERAKRGQPPLPAAKGIYSTVTVPDMGGGLGPPIQPHAGEQMIILPKTLAPSRMMVHAARGIYGNTGVNGRGIPNTRGGPGTRQTVVNVAIPPPNPLQSAMDTQRLNDHTVKTIMRHTEKALAGLVASGRA
jgi:hypothetical protein